MLYRKIVLTTSLASAHAYMVTMPARGYQSRASTVRLSDAEFDDVKPSTVFSAWPPLHAHAPRGRE